MAQKGPQLTAAVSSVVTRFYLYGIALTNHRIILATRAGAMIASHRIFVSAEHKTRS